MNMIDNYDETRLALARFIVANAPPGAERFIDSIRGHLERGEPKRYYGIEFRGENSSCDLYVELDELGYNVVEDDDGNHFSEYKIVATVNWPSFGSSPVVACQERVALMTNAVRFTTEIERAFPHVVRMLQSTKAERDAKAGRARVERLIRANMKCMRVGQQKRIEASVDNGPDFLPVGEVVVTSIAPDGSERRYTTNVTSTRAFYFTRCA